MSSNTDQTILFSMGDCIEVDGAWTRGTKALSGYGAFTQMEGTIGQVCHALTSHREATSKEALGWLSSGSYAGPAYDTWISDLATWRTGPKNKDDKPKLARSQTNVTSAQIFCFDVDGDPYAEEQVAYEEAMALWAEAGRPAGQGPTKPDGRGITSEQLRCLLIALKKTGYLFGVATTFNSSIKSAPGCYRLRIFFFADKPVTTLTDFRLARLPFLSFFDGLGIEIDSAPANWASVFYLPAFPEGVDPSKVLGIWQDGELFDVVGNIEQGKSLTKVPATVKRSTSTGRSVVEATAARGEDLPSDLEVTLADGRTIRALSLAEGQHSPCYSPWRSEAHPSAFLQECNGRVYLHDSSGRVTRWVTGFADYYTLPVTSWSTCFLTNSLRDNQVDQEGPSIPGVDQVHVLSAAPRRKGSYLADQIQPGMIADLTFFACPMGTGKTSYFRSTSFKGEKVLYCGDSRALGRSACKAMGLTSHEEIPSGKEADYLGAYTCINSLYRWVAMATAPRLAGTYVWDRFILDESVEVLAALHGSTMRGQGPQAAEALAIIMAASARIEIASADIDAEHVDLILRLARKYRSDLGTSLIYRPAAVGERKCALYSLPKWDADLCSDIESFDGKTGNLIVAFTSKVAPKVWSTRIQKIRPDLRVLVITADNSDTVEIQALLADPDRMQREYDIILYSPSIKTGVSFDLPVWRYYQSVSTALRGQSLAQTTMRPRLLSDPTIRVTIKQQRAEWVTDPATLRSIALGRATATEKSIVAADVHWALDPVTWDRVASNPWFLDSWAYQEAHKRHAKNNLVRAYVQHVSRHGFECIDRRDQEIPEELAEQLAIDRKVAREEVKAETIENIVSAPSIDEEEAEVLARAMTKTLEEKASLEQFQIGQFYALPVDGELVEADKDGKTRQVVKDYNALRLLSKKIPQAVRYLDRLDVVGQGGKTPKDPTDYAHYTLKAHIADRIIRTVLGVGIHRIHGLVIDAETIREKIEPLLADPIWVQTTREFGGFGLGPKSLENPVQWFMNFLKRFGIESSSTRPRKCQGDPDAKRPRVYTLCTEKIERLARANYIKIIDMVLHARRDFSLPEGWQDDLGGSVVTSFASVLDFPTPEARKLLTTPEEVPSVELDLEAARALLAASI